MHVAVVVLLALVTTSYACNDTICGTIPGEVKLDQADWPPSTNVVGRAAWTFLHATAAYLPHDPVTIKEKRALSYVVNGFSIIYPSPKGRELWKDVVNSKTLLAEFDHVLDRDQLILWMWKVHNCITAHLFTNKPVWPDHANLKLKREDFLVQSDGTTKMRLAALQDSERKHILAALKHRWVLPGGLEAVDVSKEAALYNSDLPPDRAGLGRATWTLLHTMSVYLPAMLTQHEQDAFCGMFDALTVIYACPVCRHHFQTVYPDPILQKEMKEINTREGAMLFLWKLHNIVVAERHPEKGLFPKVCADRRSSSDVTFNFNY